MLWELRHPDPMLPMGFFRSPIVVVAGIVNFLSLFGLFAAIFLLTLYLQSINQLSSIETGVRFLALTVPIMIASFAASIVAAKVGPRLPIAIGSALSAAWPLRAHGPGGRVRIRQLLVVAGPPRRGCLVHRRARHGRAPRVRAAWNRPVPRPASPTRSARSAPSSGSPSPAALLLRHLRDGMPDALAGTDLPAQTQAKAVELLGDGDLSRVAALPRRSGGR